MPITQGGGALQELRQHQPHPPAGGGDPARGVAHHGAPRGQREGAGGVGPAHLQHAVLGRPACCAETRARLRVQVRRQGAHAFMCCSRAPAMHGQAARPIPLHPAAALPLCCCSEFISAELRPGEVVKNTRHEDLQRTTFQDESFDLVISSEVGQGLGGWTRRHCATPSTRAGHPAHEPCPRHMQNLARVPSPYQALHELRRIMRPGAAHVFTVPFSPVRACGTLWCCDAVRYRCPALPSLSTCRPLPHPPHWTPPV